MNLRHAYRDTLVDLFDTILAEEEAALDAAVRAVAAALETGHLIYTTGSGHSHLLAEELFYRAGGIAAVQPVLVPELMLHEGAQRSTEQERVEGKAAAVLADYPIGPGDVMIVASNSGRNAYPIEVTQFAKARGATTIAITALDHARRTASRHASGKRLFEIADIVIDNHGIYGDAALPIPGSAVAMGPTSTLTGVFILNAIVAEAVAQLAARGIHPDVFVSANSQADPAAGEAILQRWKPRIRGL